MFEKFLTAQVDWENVKIPKHAILWFYSNADVNYMDGLVDGVIKIFPYKSYTSMSRNISVFAFLYLSCSAKPWTVEVCTRPNEDALLAF